MLSRVFFKAVKYCIWFQSDTSLWKLEYSSLQKVSNSIREATCTLGVQRNSRDDGEGRGGGGMEGRWFRGRAAPRAELCLAKSASLSNTASWAEMFLSSLSQHFSLKEAAKTTEQNWHVKRLTSNLLPMLSVMALILWSVCGRASCIITEVQLMICLRSLCRNSGNKY